MAKKRSLAQTWARVRTVPGMGRNVAVLAAGVVLAVAAGGVIVANQGFTAPWTEEYTFSADFTQAPGVNPDSTHKVRIAGVEVGRITGGTITPQGQSRLTFTIEPGQKIYDNAHLVLRPNNPLNEMYVEINPGGPPGRQLPSDGTIPVGQTERPVQIDEPLQHLDERARTAVQDVLTESDAALANAPENLPGGLSSVRDTMVQFRPVVDALQTRRETISSLVTSLAQISSAVGGNDTRLAGMVDDAERTLATVGAKDADLGGTLQQLPGLSDELRRAMGSTQGLTRQLDPALRNVDAAAKQLPDALRRTGGTAQQLNQTVTEARPVVSQARPVAADLRPLMQDVKPAADDLRPTTQHGSRAVATLVPYLQDLAAFVYNTSSVFSLRDANGGLIRGALTLQMPVPGGVIPGLNGGTDPAKHDPARPDADAPPPNQAPPVLKNPAGEILGPITGGP